MREEKEPTESIFRVVLVQTRKKESINTDDLPEFGDFLANYPL